MSEKLPYLQVHPDITLTTRSQELLYILPYRKILVMMEIHKIVKAR
jgi:hypothetical protein